MSAPSLHIESTDSPIVVVVVVINAQHETIIIIRKEEQIIMNISNYIIMHMCNNACEVWYLQWWCLLNTWNNQVHTQSYDAGMQCGCCFHLIFNVSTRLRLE